MALLKQTFPAPAESALVNFDFIEFVSGQGFVSFFLAEGYDGSNPTFILTSNAIHSRQILETGVVNRDYDTAPFNIPQTVRGTAQVSISVATTSTQDLTLTAQIFKWDGTTETALSSAVSELIGDDNAQAMFLFNLPLTETTIEEGEMIRLNIIADTTNSAYGQDPAGRDSGTITAGNGVTSASRVLIPFNPNI